ncbi:tRNA lysidine(34) synthetase TilS, partial [Hydrogenophaga sp.]|uniref:tRNA lysidine(34) synthetase TilS n=1 Tax=Hydrogenophaga sp. TaxID=1904254 RepID=UPI003562A4AE
HVHHGLQAAADHFEAQARASCAQHQIALHVRHIQAAHRPGQSPEDAARQGRYSALAAMALAQGVACVLLGQHADDQVETVLLALSRGAGVPGLAAMPAQFTRHGVRFDRPLLDLEPQALRAWLVASGHGFAEDPSNTDQRYTRNRIRALLLPAWQACFPGHRQALARSARHAAQAQRLLDDLAAMDMAQTGAPPALTPLRSLRRDRQANLLRYWLLHRHGARASTAQLDELLDQVEACATRGHRIHIKVGLGFVVRSGERLDYTPPI